jgi:hypothetical protein
MTLLSAVLAAWLAAAAAERPAIVVQAPDSPVRIDRASVVQGADGPPVILYSATNPTDTAIDEFTVMAFVFDANGVLKARQTAPGRRTLDARGTKYSTLVLDGSPIEATYQIVIGVNQAQREGSETWWHADLQPAAEAAVPLKKR